MDPRRLRSGTRSRFRAGDTVKGFAEVEPGALADPTRLGLLGFDFFGPRVVRKGWRPGSASGLWVIPIVNIV